jgi:hypothetical protein
MSHAVLDRPVGEAFSGFFSSLGMSESASAVESHLRETLRRYKEPVTTARRVAADGSLADRFAALAERWREDTRYLSSSTAIFMHPAYQEIIGMGPAVLPFMLRDMLETESHWFWALRAITGENPVDVRSRGNVERMMTGWRGWGIQQGLL